MLIDLLLEGEVILYACLASGIVIAIVFHELAHGAVAIWEGDRTPIELGHMTVNPFVHMGAISLVTACVIGVAWGLMPVDPTRFRHRRYGDVLVSLAGPATNVFLSLVSLVALGFWVRALPDPVTDLDELGQTWGQTWLWTFGYLNIGLAIFNMAPVPPLDGSRVLSGISARFKRFIDNLEHPGYLFMGYFFLLMVMEETDYGLWTFSSRAADEFVIFIVLL